MAAYPADKLRIVAACRDHLDRSVNRAIRLHEAAVGGRKTLAVGKGRGGRVGVRISDLVARHELINENAAQMAVAVDPRADIRLDSRKSPKLSRAGWLGQRVNIAEDFAVLDDNRAPHRCRGGPVGGIREWAGQGTGDDHKVVFVDSAGAARECRSVFFENVPAGRIGERQIGRDDHAIGGRFRGGSAECKRRERKQQHVLQASFQCRLKHQQVPFRFVSVAVNVYGINNHNTAYGFCQEKTNLFSRASFHSHKFNAHLTVRL